jgi:integrase
MATITPRDDDQGIRIGWQARVRKKGYPQQVKTFRRKAEAEAWAKSVEAEMERGLWRDTTEAQATILREAFQRYAEEVSRHKKGAEQEQWVIAQWQRRKIAKLSLARIGGRNVAEAMREMEDEGKSASTIRQHLAILSHLFKIARSEWGMEGLENPVTNVRKPKPAQGRDRRLQGDEETRLLAECKASGNPWLLAVVRFALETAMRQGEILGLTWKHVDLNRRIAVLSETKNGTSRTVPLSSVAVEVLRGVPRSVGGRVFPTSQNALRLAFPRACKRAEIEDLRFHDLRHEATSRLFEKGFNPMEVSTITGHKTLQMLKRYTHLRAEDLAKRMG